MLGIPQSRKYEMNVDSAAFDRLDNYGLYSSVVTRLGGKVLRDQFCAHSMTFHFSVLFIHRTIVSLQEHQGNDANFSISFIRFVCWTIESGLCCVNYKEENKKGKKERRVVDHALLIQLSREK